MANGTTPTYEVGSRVLYSAFGGEGRTVTVTYKSSDIKNGRPGFDGKLDSGETVWGYDDQIEEVL